MVQILWEKTWERTFFQKADCILLKKVMSQDYETTSISTKYPYTFIRPSGFTESSVEWLWGHGDLLKIIV